MPAPEPQPILRYDKVPSTNTVALELARQNAVHGTVVVARQQGAGKGRGGKDFSSPAGGLYMSVILRPDLVPEKLPFISLAAGVACARAIQDLARLAVALKWPNDLYLQGRKLGGILAETVSYAARGTARPCVVLGIGINVNTPMDSFPPGLRNIVTSLYALTSFPYDLDTLQTGIQDHLTAELQGLQADVTGLVRAWRARDYLLGRAITWHDVRGVRRHGRGAGLLADGSYQLITPDGDRHAILAGEVTFGPVG